MSLSGEDFKKLQDAILQAYPNKSDLEQMVRFYLDENLDAIARGQTTTEIIYSLINDWVEPQGKLQDLLIAVLKDRPNKLDLQETLDKLLEKYCLRQKQIDVDQNIIFINNVAYIKHQNIEQHCYRVINKSGGFLRIKAPEQMGKLY